MKIVADTHCHTIASTHAYSTIMENVNEASKKGLYAIAITDHANNMPGSPGPFYYENLRVIPKNINGVYVLKGIEANVIDYNGNIDVSDDIISKLDWVIASMHGPTLHSPKSIDECTAAWLNIARNPYVKVIGHCGSPIYKFDYEKVIPEFGKNNKLVEINNATFRIRKDYIPNCKEIALLCKKYRVSVIINSDSHFCTQIGNVDLALSMLREIDFSEDLIINADKDRFKEYINNNTTFFNN